jgi:class 3 adenylate cyclase
VSQLGVQYGEALSVQRSILREEFRRWHGREMGTAGDSFFVVFTSALDAVRAALGAQRRLASYSWPGGAVVRVRMGLHTAEPTRYEDEYVGMEVHRAARIASAAHGGQVVVSAETAQVLSSRSPEVKLKDLGWHRLNGLVNAEDAPIT